MGIVYFLHVSLHEILFFFSVLFIVYVQQQLDLPTKDVYNGMSMLFRSRMFHQDNQN